MQGETIRRIQKDAMKEPVDPDIPVYRYEKPKKPDMPPSIVQWTPLPLRSLLHRHFSVHRAQESDFLFLKTVASEEVPLEYGGYNTREARIPGCSVKPSTQAFVCGISLMSSHLFNELFPDCL